MHLFSANDDHLPLSKFESMLKTNSVYFFDSSEFEEIVLHYMNVGKMSLAKKALDLGLKLPLEDRKVIWSVSISAQKRHRPNWSKLGRLFKCDRRTVQHNYRGALMRAYYLQ